MSKKLFREEIILLYLKDPKLVIDLIRNGGIKKSDEIRELICEFPVNFAYCYALFVDRKSHPLTRTACCRSPGYAYWYAVNIAGSPTKETRQAAYKDTKVKNIYILWEKGLKAGTEYRESLAETVDILLTGEEK